MAEIPTVRTTRYGKNSFRFESARVWNSLPNDMGKVENFKEFKSLRLDRPGMQVLHLPILVVL